MKLEILVDYDNSIDVTYCICSICYNIPCLESNYGTDHLKFPPPPTHTLLQQGTVARGQAMGKAGVRRQM